MTWMLRAKFRLLKTLKGEGGDDCSIGGDEDLLGRAGGRKEMAGFILNHCQRKKHTCKKALRKTS